MATRRPYIASNQAEPGALPVLLAASLAAGVAVGALEGFVAQWLSLLLLFPMAVGLVVGAVALKVVTARKIRKPLAAAAIAALGGFVAETTAHVVKYRTARSEIAEALERGPQTAEFVQSVGLDSATDTLFAGREGRLPFLGYLEMAAESGITITSSHSSSSKSSSPTLTGTGVYTLWAINYLIVIGVALAMAFAQAKSPFCEECKDWYGKEEAVAVGAGDTKALKATMERLQQGQLEEAVRELGKSDGKTAAVVLLKSCGTCTTHEPVIELKTLAGLNTKKTQQAIVYRSLVTQSEAQAMRAAVPPAPAAAPPVPA